MQAFKEIDIAEPIWKTRSVGLAVDDVPMSQIVKITISYKRKDGSQLYPGEYLVDVDNIRKYPVETVRGNIRVHIVPIKDLANLKVNNNPKNQSPMLFGSDELNKIVKESEEAKAGNFENKKMIEPGKHLLTLVEIELTKTKTDQMPMVVAEFQLDEDHRTIKEFFKIAGPNTDIPREKLVKMFHRGFNYAIQPAKTEADLMNQLTQFKGKQLAVAVRGRKKAYAFQTKEGKDVVMEQTYPEYWYAATAAEFDDLTVDLTKAILEPTPEDKQKLLAFAELNGGPYVPKSQQTEQPTSQPASDAGANTAAPATGNATPAPQKIEEVPAKEAPAEAVAPAQPQQEAAAPQQEVAPEAPAAGNDASAPAENNGGGDDNFPF